MKYKNSFIGSISALAGILLVILMIVNGILVQESFLNYTNHKYGVEKNLSMTEADLKKVVHGMVSYVKGKIDSPQVTVKINDEDVEFFNKKELGHLEDVRVLIQHLYISMIVLMLICVAGEGYLIYKKDYNTMGKGVFLAWGILLSVAAIIGILAIIDIDIVVTGFHQMFLADSNWILNPAKDRSVWMFRTSMYKDVILVLAGIVGGTALVTLTASFVMKRKKKK